jgi:hypothetical protein
LRNFVIAIFLTLLILAFLEVLCLLFSRSFAWHLLARRAGSFWAMVANIALKVVVSARAWQALDDRFVIFAVEALGVLLAAHVGDRLSKEALAVAMTTVVRGP